MSMQKTKTSTLPNPFWKNTMIASIVTLLGRIFYEITSSGCITVTTVLILILINFNTKHTFYHSFLFDIRPFTLLYLLFDYTIRKHMLAYGTARMSKNVYRLHH